MSYESQLRAKCRQVIASEMRSYDQLSRKARIVYEKSAQRAVDEGAIPTFHCAHNKPLVDPCDKCCRTDEDCKVYRVAAMFRLQELLSQLNTKEVK